MRSNKLLLLIVIFVQIVFSVYSQEVISSAGHYDETSGAQVSWTIGEPAIETIISEGNILTQGFQQTKMVITAVISYNENIQVFIYPNPTDDLVNIDIFGLQFSETKVGVYTMEGKLLKQQYLITSTSVLNIHGLASGSYLLKVTDKNNPIKTFKLVKR